MHIPHLILRNSPKLEPFSVPNPQIMAPSKRKQQPSEPSEGDLVAARAAVHLASLQRKVASWLPPKTEEQMAREKERDDDSDEEEFEVGYETYVIFSLNEYIDTGFNIDVIPIFTHKADVEVG